MKAFVEKPKNSIPIEEGGSAPTFRGMLSQILNLFLHDRSEVTIKKALALISSFVDADRVCLRVFALEEGLSNIDYNVRKEDIPDYQYTIHDYTREIDLDGKGVEWIKRCILSGKEIVLDDLNELPTEYESFRELLVRNQVRSALILPIFWKDKVIGYLALEFLTRPYKWREIDIENLKIISDILSNTIDHERTSRAMKISALNSLKNEMLLNIVFEKLPVGIELYDEKGLLTHMNPADLEILGTTKEAVLGVSLFDNPMITEETKEKFRKGEEVVFENQYCFDSIRSTGYYDNRFSNLKKSLLGNCVPLKDTQGNIFGYLQLVHDNTEDYKRKKELEYNLTKLKMALDTGNALIWEYDVKTNMLSVDETLNRDITAGVFNNPNHLEKQTAEDQLKGLHPDDAVRFYEQAFMPMLRGEINQVTISYRQYVAGKVEWLTSNFRSIIPEGQDKPDKVFCYTIVTTDQHELERELIEIKETDRLKTLFMENLSHEIRTPLNAIIGFSHVIAEDNRSEEHNVLVNLINENNTILLHLVDNMLDLSKIETGEMKYKLDVVDIKDVCTDRFKFYSTKMTHPVSLRFDSSLPSFQLYSDKQRVLQVIDQLLDNAIKFTRAGEISISYHTIDKDKLKIIVSDTGIGLAKQAAKYIFNPFYKADQFTKGAGLGLHIAQQIVKDLGGEIGVESEKDKGSVFWFTLPFAKMEN